MKRKLYDDPHLSAKSFDVPEHDDSISIGNISNSVDGSGVWTAVQLYMNGEFVGDGWIRGDVPDSVNYQTTDATKSAETNTNKGRLQGLQFALTTCKQRQNAGLSHAPAYGAAIEEIMIFLEAAIYRVEHGGEMHSAPNEVQ